MLNNKSVLITGATGSFGTEYIFFILKKYPKIKKLIVFSRDELKQYNLNKKISVFFKKEFESLRFFLGDVRDKERLIRATKDVDYIIHAAALKQVPAAEYNPFEFVKTNIMGAQNIIDAALENKIKKVIALSTDKACSPINFYGATKLCSDKLFISANNFKGKTDTSFAVVRYGNVMGSRGSVIPLFLELKLNKINTFPITSKQMTRFNITLEESVKMVDWTLKNSVGGEIFVPKLKSYKILDVAKSINNNFKINIIGLRPGEKVHEELISSHDSPYVYDVGKYYVIANAIDNQLLKFYNQKGKRVNENFVYSSNSNNDFLSVKELKFLISNEMLHK
jgi:nucleoside-diphosphate-sugar epimerase